MTMVTASFLLLIAFPLIVPVAPLKAPVPPVTVAGEYAARAIQ